MGCLNSAHFSSTTLLKLLTAGHDKSAHLSQDHQANLGDAIACQDKCSIRYASRSSIPNGSHIGASTLRVFSQRKATSYLDSTQDVIADLCRIASRQVNAGVFPVLMFDVEQYCCGERSGSVSHIRRQLPSSMCLRPFTTSTQDLVVKTTSLTIYVPTIVD
jgi:hypothetical protein